MKEVELYRWHLPDPKDPSKTRLSRWRMTAEGAADRSAVLHEPTSRMVVRVGDLGLSDTSRSGPRPWWMKPDLLRLPVVTFPRWVEDLDRPWPAGA